MRRSDLAVLGLGLAVLAAAARAVAGDVARGKVVYEGRCATCHGSSGAGDGPAAAAIAPKPRNFLEPEFWKGRTSGDLRLVVRQGKPGTLMPPFDGFISDAELDDVVAYLETFRPKAP